MEASNNRNQHAEDKIEQNYAENQHDPGPSKEAVQEKNDKPASKVLNWVTLIICIILGLIYLFFIR